MTDEPLPPRFKYPPQVAKHRQDGSQFYVAGLAQNGNDRWLYLHSDYQWRITTESEAGMTGYFASEAEAARVLARALLKTETKSPSGDACPPEGKSAR